MPFQRGITVVEWGPTAFEQRATAALVRRLDRHHVDAVTIPIVWNQSTPQSTEVRPGRQTARSANVAAAVRAARRRGMRVVIRPYVDVDDDSWRGSISPASLDRWFTSYTRFVLKFARFAERHGAAGFVVGSEMKTLSGETARWTALVRAVRQRFGGFVTYQANWDEVQSVTWWSKLDAISISAYFPLTHSSVYSVKDLIDGWKKRSGVWNRDLAIFDGIRALQRRHRRPVLFGEVGYTASAGSARAPWERWAGEDEAAQAAAYAAALRVWYRVPWFRGMHWWFVNPQRKLLAGTPADTHRPRDAALQTLRRWYAKRR